MDSPSKPKKLRRSGSGSSYTVQSQLLAMKQFERKVTNDTSSSNSDEGGRHNNFEQQLAKKNKKEKKKKKRRHRLTIDSDSSSTGDDRKKRSKVDNEVVKKKKKEKSPMRKSPSSTSSSQRGVVPPKRKMPFIPVPAALSKTELKPVLKVGDEVYSAWWPTPEKRKTNTDSSWYEGRIKSVRRKVIHNRGNEYGATYLYDIDFDDGDELDGVEDAFVFPKVDYLLEEKNKKWLGVKNVMDPKSKDMWAELVGWHEATIDGETYSFPLLSAALQAYDTAVVNRKGSKTRQWDLNLPEEWHFDSRENITSMEMEDSEESGSSTLSSLKGFVFKPDKKKYKAKIKYGENDINLGYYKLASDAARAYDRALDVLRGEEARTNFDSEDAYKSSRALEMKETNLHVDYETIQAKIASKIDDITSKICPSSSSAKTVDGAVSETKKSDYVGVSYHKHGRRWQAGIGHNNKQTNLGHYKLETDAAHAYDEASRQIRGQNARVNFSTMEDYNLAKKNELKRTGLSSDDAVTHASILSKVSEVVSKILTQKSPSPSGNDSTKPAAKVVNKRGRPAKSKEANELTCPNCSKGFASQSGLDYHLERNVCQNKLPQSKGAGRPPSTKVSAAAKISSEAKSDYIGVSYNNANTNNKWESRIFLNNEETHLGIYKFETDAAMAYDEAAKQVRGLNVERNFVDMNEYKQAKLSESNKSDWSDGDALTQTAIQSRVCEVMRNRFPSVVKEESIEEGKEREMTALNDAMAQKWGPYLPKISDDKNFLTHYQTSINDMLQDLHPKPKSDDVSPPVSPPLTSKPLPPTGRYSNESEVSTMTTNDQPGPKSNGNGLLKEDVIMEDALLSTLEKSVTSDKPSETQPKLSSTPLQQKPSKASPPKVLDQPSASNTVVSTTASAATTKARTKKKLPENIKSLTDGQVNDLDLPFRIGCPVWFQFDTVDSFQTGKVSNIFMDFVNVTVYYQVKVIGGDTKERMEMVPDTDICHAPQCQITITLPSLYSITDTVHNGEVLMCRGLTRKDVVMNLKQALQKKQQNEKKIEGILTELESTPMSRKLLADTLIGKAVTQIAKQSVNSSVSRKACELIKKWKEIAAAEKQSAAGGALSSGQEDDVCGFSYTVLVTKEKNQFQIYENVKPKQVKYRMGN